jgi:hypothetical protein
MKNFPHIYYTNVDRKVGRRAYMENQFNKFKLPYTRIEMLSCPKDGPPKNFLDRLVGTYNKNTCQWINWYASLLFEFFKEWIENTNDPFFIFMEDDYDLSLMSLWHFEWDEFMDRLPYGWDCIQLGFETPYKIPFYLHPTQPEYSLGASLLNREYVEKLLDLHYPNGKFKFDYTIANSLYLNRGSGIHDDKDYCGTSGGPDYYINQSGNCYSIPLIPINPYFAGISHQGPFGKLSWEPKLSFVKCYEAYHEWWNNDRDNFTLDEFFTYGKSNDILMERDITRWDDKYFHDKALTERLEYEE